MRNLSIDIARGLAIMIVISWQIIGIHSIWTDGWVMPLFFVIMGLFYHHAISFKDLLKKKVKTILLPHFICSIPAFVISLINEGIYETLRCVLNPYSCINPVSWFLISMFFCYLIYWVINYVANDNNFKRAFLAFGVSVFSFYVSQIYVMGFRFVLPYYISASLTAMVFVEIGRLIAVTDLLKSHACLKFIWRRKYGYLFWILFLIILFILNVVLFHPRSGNMIWNSYDNSYLVYIMNGAIGSLFVIEMCGLLKNIFIWVAPIGRLSLLMLVLHMYIYYFMSFLGENVIFEYITTIVLTMAIAYAIEKRFPFILGKF